MIKYLILVQIHLLMNATNVVIKENLLVLVKALSAQIVAIKNQVKHQ